ncbi:hypothetical protein [Helicobacter pylori]|uniref:hypothetical protein n=1 Tax=Helicobacter pylori TaxID=210 RepID=UPI001AA8FF94|nr:hypothetical protein [Helicobacter pylori]GHR94199.1 hypothetical protein JP0111_03880 [Helicobacter pylori]
MKWILFFLVATTFLLRAETDSATINTTVDPNVMFSESSTGNVKKDRKRVLKNMVNLEKERVKNFNQYSETKMSKGDLSAFGAFFRGSLESCVDQKICYYEHKNGKVSFVVNDREKFYKHVLKDLGTELSLPLFNWLYKGSDFGALHEQFGDMYDGYIKYLISMVRISQKEKARKLDAVTLKKMEDQAEKDTKAAFQKRSNGELESHTGSPEFISSSKEAQNASNPDPDSTANANALKETASKEPETSLKKEKKSKKKRRLSKKERQQQALQQEFERQISDSSKSENIAK